jgi:hypothetical protein
MTEIGKSGLQAQVAKLLDRLGIVYVRSRTDKRTTNAPGTPDFIFSVLRNFSHFCPCAWEVKLPKQKLKPKQDRMRERMTAKPNAWRYAIITSIAEAEQELKEIGLLS